MKKVCALGHTTFGAATETDAGGYYSSVGSSSLLNMQYAASDFHLKKQAWRLSMSDIATPLKNSSVKPSRSCEEEHMVVE
jgi:hypothetical protein